MRRSGTTRIDEVLRWVRGPDVLDIGCSGQAGRRSALGSSWWLHGRLLERFPSVTGLEYSDANVAELAAAGIPGVVQGDAQDFDLGGEFDTIVAGEIIEHLERPGAFLHAAERHLKPGGRLVLTTPYAFGVVSVLYAWVKFPRTCSNPEHVSWFCPATIAALAERCGFAVERCDVIASHRPDLTRRSARLATGVMRTIGRLLPARMRANTMVVVLRRAG